MDTQMHDGQTAEGYGDESLNTASTRGEQGGSDNQAENHKKGGIHNNALYAASMGRPVTAQVDPHNNSDLANTGTNISYEGPTAPGSGGSVGSGYTSGQSGVGSSIASVSDYDRAGVGNATGGKEQSLSAGDNTVDATDELNEQQ